MIHFRIGCVFDLWANDFSYFDGSWLEVNNMTIKQVEHVEYLGDLINLQDDNFYLIKSES